MVTTLQCPRSPQRPARSHTFQPRLWPPLRLQCTTMPACDSVNARKPQRVQRYKAVRYASEQGEKHAQRIPSVIIPAVKTRRLRGRPAETEDIRVRRPAGKGGENPQKLCWRKGKDEQDRNDRKQNKSVLHDSRRKLRKHTLVSPTGSWRRLVRAAKERHAGQRTIRMQ